MCVKSYGHPISDPRVVQEDIAPPPGLVGGAWESTKDTHGETKGRDETTTIDEAQSTSRT